MLSTRGYDAVRAPGPHSRSDVPFLLFGIASLLVVLSACGPSTANEGASESDSASGTTQDPGATDTSMETTAGTCGDGTPQQGEYCFERIELPDIVGPGRLVAADLDADGRDEVAFRRQLTDELQVVAAARWNEGFEVIAMDETSGDGLVYFPAQPVAGAPQQLLSRANAESVLVRRWLSDAVLSSAAESVDMPGYLEMVVLGVDIDADGSEEAIAYDRQPGTEFLTPYALSRADPGMWAVVGSNLPVQTVGHNGPAATAADLDGDGSLEIVITDDVGGGASYDPEQHHVVVLRPIGGGYTEIWRGPAGVLAEHELALADLDVDGTPDLLVTGTLGVAARRGAGDGGFGDLQMLDLGDYGLEEDEFLRGSAVGDIDGDGTPELLITSDASPHAEAGWQLLVVTQPLADAQVSILESNVGPVVLEALDFDNDGFDDVFLDVPQLDSNILVLLRSNP